MEIMSESDSDRLSVNRFFSFPFIVFLNPMKFFSNPMKILSNPSQFFNYRRNHQSYHGRLQCLFSKFGEVQETNANIETYENIERCNMNMIYVLNKPSLFMILERFDG